MQNPPYTHECADFRRARPHPRSRPSVIAWSTQSSAMCRYVVHFPPVIVSRPDRVHMNHVIARESRSLALALHQRPQTHINRQHICARWRTAQSNRAAVSRMNSISSSSARGSRLGASTGVSVVPATACPCHGITNSTRPSLVLRHHQRGIALQERPVEDKVNALARHHQRFSLGIGHRRESRR